MFRSVFLETKYEPNIGFLLTPNNNNRLSTVGSRAFPVAGLQTWNDLPEDVTSAESMTTFFRLFKTHLFRKSFPDYLLHINWLDLAVVLLLRPPKNWLIDLSITSTTVVLGKITCVHAGAYSVQWTCVHTECRHIGQCQRSTPWQCDQLNHWWRCYLTSVTTILHRCGPPASAGTDNITTTTTNCNDNCY